MCLASRRIPLPPDDQDPHKTLVFWLCSGYVPSSVCSRHNMVVTGKIFMMVLQAALKALLHPASTGTVNHCCCVSIHSRDTSYCYNFPENQTFFTSCARALVNTIILLLTGRLRELFPIPPSSFLPYSAIFNSTSYRDFFALFCTLAAHDDKWSIFTLALNI